MTLAPAIDLNEAQASLDLGKEQELSSLVLNSLSIPKGDLLEDKNFGHRLNEIKNTTQDSISLAENFVFQALEWLIKIGKVLSIEVTAEKDGNDPTRINFLIKITKKDQREITFSFFKEVA